MPIDAASRENAPMPQNSGPIHDPTSSLRRLPSTSRKLMSSGRSGWPNTVEYASIEVKAIVTIVITTKVESCSMLANRHQARQRLRLRSVGSNT
jgi:hypothetical protein